MLEVRLLEQVDVQRVGTLLVYSVRPAQSPLAFRRSDDISIPFDSNAKYWLDASVFTFRCQVEEQA